jgi:hypothetical protein
MHDLFLALNNNQVRYLLVGGWAVTLFGVRRSTADIDLIIDLESSNIAKFDKAALEADYTLIGYVPLNTLVSPEIRKQLSLEKNLLVISYTSEKNDPTVDILLDYPFTFEILWKNRLTRGFGPNEINLISKDDLIALKLYSGRPQDIEDIAKLRTI